MYCILYFIDSVLGEQFSLLFHVSPNATNRLALLLAVRKLPSCFLVCGLCLCTCTPDSSMYRIVSVSWVQVCSSLFPHPSWNMPQEDDAIVNRIYKALFGLIVFKQGKPTSLIIAPDLLELLKKPEMLAVTLRSSYLYPTTGISSKIQSFYLQLPLQNTFQLWTFIVFCLWENVIVEVANWFHWLFSVRLLNKDIFTSK